MTRIRDGQAIRVHVRGEIVGDGVVDDDTVLVGAGDGSLANV
jgi:hypothetical protein